MIIRHLEVEESQKLTTIINCNNITKKKIKIMINFHIWCLLKLLNVMMGKLFNNFRIILIYAIILNKLSNYKPILIAIMLTCKILYINIIFYNYESITKSYK